MRRRHCRRYCGLALVLAAWSATAVLAAASGEPLITPVAGLSTLRSHGLTVARTSMGFTARLGPPPDAPLPPDGALSITASGRRTITGADLYRLNCRACHRANGGGAPPEVNSLI